MFVAAMQAGVVNCVIFLTGDLVEWACTILSRYVLQARQPQSHDNAISVWEHGTSGGHLAVPSTNAPIAQESPPLRAQAGGQPKDSRVSTPVFGFVPLAIEHR
jgi:hypothetical protein